MTWNDDEDELSGDALAASIAREVELQQRVQALERERDEAKAKHRKAMLALEGLTPSGSEFVGDPDACVAYVRRTWDSNRNVIGSFKDQRDKAIAERDSWKAEAQKWERLHNELAEPLLFEQPRDNFGPTEEMPETVKRIISERDAAERLLIDAGKPGKSERLAGTSVWRGTGVHAWFARREALLTARKLIPEGK